MKVTRLVLVVLTGLLTAHTASALSMERHAGYYAGSGGEFSVYGTSFTAGYAGAATYNGLAFQTFCLERKEKFTLRPTDYTIEQFADAGGDGFDTALGGDPLSVGTSWLYKEFAAGTLAGYGYTPGAQRAASSKALQESFWWLEHEQTLANPGANPYLALAAASLGLSLSDLRLNAAFSGNSVSVINWTQDGARKQSMLVYRPTDAPVVAVPDGGATLAMLGLAMLGCGAARRRWMLVANR